MKSFSWRQIAAKDELEICHLCRLAHYTSDYENNLIAAFSMAFYLSGNYNGANIYSIICPSMETVTICQGIILPLF
jgi:hypothetical protein